MSKFMEKFRSSAKELNSLENLTFCAMLLALSLVISSLTIQVGNTIKIGFSFLPCQLAYMLFGPVVGGLFGGVVDVLGYIIKPTGAFFPGFTINAILTGVIYGTIMYKKPVRLTRVIAAQAIITVFINILLNTYWLSILLGKGFMVMLPARVIKNIIMLPINAALFYTVAKILERNKLLQHFGYTRRFTRSTINK